MGRRVTGAHKGRKPIRDYLVGFLLGLGGDHCAT